MTKSHEADVEFIGALADLLHKHKLNELEVRRDFAENESLTVRIVGQNAAPPQHSFAPAAPATSVGHAPMPVAAPRQIESVEDPALLPGAVTSPMVGTIYLSPEPGAAAFVSLGDQVSEGQTLFIIEAMKTMNHIPAPKSGRVSRIFVEDASPVEFGAPLLVLE